MPHPSGKFFLGLQRLYFRPVLTKICVDFKAIVAIFKANQSCLYFISLVICMFAIRKAITCIVRNTEFYLPCIHTVVVQRYSRFFNGWEFSNSDRTRENDNNTQNSKTFYRWPTF